MTKDKTTVKHPQNNQTEAFEEWCLHNKDIIRKNWKHEVLEHMFDDLTTKHQAEIAECRNGMMLLPIVKEKDKKISELENDLENVKDHDHFQTKEIKELTAENDTNKKMLLSLKEANKDMRSFEDVLTIGFQEKKITELEDKLEELKK